MSCNIYDVFTITKEQEEATPLGPLLVTAGFLVLCLVLNFGFEKISSLAETSLAVDEDIDESEEHVQEVETDCITSLDLQTKKNTHLNAFVGLDLSNIKEDEQSVFEKDFNLNKLQNRYSGRRSVEPSTPFGPNLVCMTVETPSKSYSSEK